MVKFKNIAAVAFCLVCAVIIIVLNTCPVNLPRDLFDVKTLSYINMLWLKKPEHSYNELCMVRQNGFHVSYLYECDVDDENEFSVYTENVFNNLIKGDYKTAYFLRQKEVGENITYESWREVAASERYEDYVNNNGSRELDKKTFRCYFSFSGLGLYRNKYHGKKLKKPVGIEINCFKKGGGDTNRFTVSIEFPVATDTFVITDKEYLQEVKNS